jgi:nitrite reductase/ring-hydroxylating ferredoxin subunit
MTISDNQDITGHRAGRFAQLVRPDEGLVDRSIFTDEDIYQLELERIFGRCWLFLAHESQIPKPGDFFSTTMGEDPVLVVRQRDGSIAAFLNSCRHRGARVCRADMGNAKAFTCSYHGWAYDIAGALRVVPNLSDAYHDELNLDRWGLVQVAQLETFHGLIFATWDPAAPKLLDSLGDMAWYMEGFFDRDGGGTEVLGGVHKWMFKGNWKLAAEQFASDMYHGQTSHSSAMMALAQGLDHVDERDSAQQFTPKPENLGRQFSSPLGHGTGWFDDNPQAGDTTPPAEKAWEASQRDARIAHLGVDSRPGGHTTVFPAFSYLKGRLATVRAWHPRGPHQFEVYAWVLIDKSTPPEIREIKRREAIQSFSPSGIFEQDDGENWAGIQSVMRGRIQRRYPFNYQMGMGHEHRASDLPGHIGYVFDEMAARGFYRRYAQLMDSGIYPNEPPAWTPR